MTFGGFQKLTLLDFPGTVACILFTKGCNFRCPFCHNAGLVTVSSDAGDISDTEVLEFLKKRRGILEGVCITGGEPLLHEALPDFITKVRALGYKIKLDTNGSFPERLRLLLDAKLLDYVAMDIKNCEEKYHLTAGTPSLDLQKISESIELLSHCSIPTEFRTTVTCELHSADDIASIARRLPPDSTYFLQNFVDSGNILAEGMHPVDSPTLEKMAKAAQKFVKNTKIR